MCRGLEKSCTEYYRFGFNGKENDKEWGNQLIQDYGFRLYNPAIGKFLSVDPLAPEYPWYSPYHFAGNGPIENIDLDGLEPFRAADGRLLYRVKDRQGPSQIAADLNTNYGFLGRGLYGPTQVLIDWEDIVEAKTNLGLYFYHMNPNDRKNKNAKQFNRLNMNEGDIIDLSFWDGYSKEEIKEASEEVFSLRLEWLLTQETIADLEEDIRILDRSIQVKEQLISSAGHGKGERFFKIGLQAHISLNSSIIETKTEQINELRNEGNARLRESQELAKIIVEYIQKNHINFEETPPVETENK